MARPGQAVTPPPTAYNPSPTYSDNRWLESIWYALTNLGASPGGLGGGGTQYTQGSTTGSASGNVALFRYNATAPTYTDGQLEPGQLDANGNQKIVGNVPAGGTDSGNGVKQAGVYNATAPTYTSGQRADFQTDNNGNQKVTLATLLAGEDLTNAVLAVTEKPVNSNIYAPSVYQMPSTAVAAANIKPSGGSVQSFMVSNGNAAVRYFQIHNTTAAPAGGAVPLRSFPISAGTATNPSVLLIDRQYLTSLIYCSTGISFGFSTTYLTYTAATATDHFIDLNYL